MSEFIEAFHELDKCLAKSFSIDIQPVLVLQDIESGSIRTRLSSVLKLIDDEALKDLDWKKQVGKYLVKAKHKVIKFLDQQTEINSLEPVRNLEEELFELAKETDIQHIPMYTTVPTQKLLESIAYISRAPYSLSDKDHVSFISEEGEDVIRRGPYITSQTVEELLTKEILNKQMELVLLVKKPDYLGNSMWDVQYSGRTIQTKILDIDWLERFHNREIGLSPGDSLRALIHLEIKIGENKIVIGEHYTVLKVFEVIKQINAEQMKFE